jgi:hypothetical protein
MSSASTAKVTSIELREAAPGTHVFIMDHALSAASCEDMVARFEASPDDHYAGRVGQARALDTDVKRSTDLVLSGKSQWQDVDKRLFGSLRNALHELRGRYPFFAGPFKDVGYAIQRTRAQEFFHWHVDSGSHEMAQRQLVAIWYLNTVDGPGGETEFRYQNVKVAPRQGRLLLFPPFWTHEHRGVTLEAGVKYIATTWLAFA